MTWFLGLPRWAHYGIAAVAAIAAFLIWLAVHDHNVRKADRAKINETVIEKNDEAQDRANELERYRDAKRRQDEKELRDTVTDAERNNPDETSKPAGPAVRGVLDRLRQPSH